MCQFLLLVYLCVFVFIFLGALLFFCWGDAFLIESQRCCFLPASTHPSRAAQDVPYESVGSKRSSGVI